MDVVAYLPADPEAAEPVQVGKRALYDPALGAQAGAVLGAPAGDLRLHAEVPNQAAVGVVVVAAVAEYHVRAAPGSAAFASHWRHGLPQRFREVAGVPPLTYLSQWRMLLARLVRAGELWVSGESPEEVDSYFDTENFAFHGPDGFDTNYAGLADYFRALRSALAERSIRCCIVLVESHLIACQTWIEGIFERPFTHSPVGRLEPTGTHVVMELINIFRFDDRGRIVKEFVMRDNRSFLRQLGAENM